MKKGPIRDQALQEWRRSEIERERREREAANAPAASADR